MRIANGRAAQTREGPGEKVLGGGEMFFLLLPGETTYIGRSMPQRFSKDSLRCSSTSSKIFFRMWHSRGQSKRGNEITSDPLHAQHSYLFASSVAQVQQYNTPFLLRNKQHKKQKTGTTSQKPSQAHEQECCRAGSLRTLHSSLADYCREG